MNASDVCKILDDIAATSSRGAKEEILGRFAAAPMFQRVLRYAYDPFITFGLTPPKVESVGRQDFDHDCRSIWVMLDGLAKRRITGGEAFETVKSALARLSPGASEVLWRILSKDLRCGISTSTINKVAPGTIPSFDVMLAHPFEEKRVKSWPAIAEPKLDGVRVICLVKEGAVQFFSRSGKLFPAAEHLGPKVAQMVSNATIATGKMPNGALAALYSTMLGSGNHCIALDGEIITGNFNKTVGDIRRKDAQATDAEYHIFDAIPFDTMTGTSKAFELSYESRRNFVRWMVEQQSDPALRKLPSYLVGSAEEARQFYQRFRDAGLEGAIIKPLDGFYEKKRSFGWLKLKAEESKDLRVIGSFEGTGKYAGKLGGLIVDHEGVEVRVGGGFSDPERDELWRHAKADEIKIIGQGDITPGDMRSLGCQLYGRLVEVEYHEITPDGSLRHPRFVRFRDDKDELERGTA